MSGTTLIEKIWRQHVVRDLGDGRSLIYVDRHVIHEGTTRPAFEGLRKAGLRVRRPRATFAVIDHGVATSPGRSAETHEPTRARALAMRENCREFGIDLIDIDDPRQGISHVIAPELGIVLPGTTLVCGDSHTSTNGALGAWAWGIGSTEVQYVLATQSLIQPRPVPLRVVLEGRQSKAISAKDLILNVIRKLGASGGNGMSIEYAGPVVREMPIEGRLTLCNMSIEMGARAGIMAPDDAVFEYLHGRPFAPVGKHWDAALAHWRSLKSDDDAHFAKEATIDVSSLSPQVTWGTSPQDVIGIDETVPAPEHVPDADRRKGMLRSLEYMDVRPGQVLQGLRIDVAFLGSCTNGRLSDLQAAAAVVRGRKVASGVRALVVPGSTQVKAEAERLGLNRVFTDAGFEWRESACSMCVATNGDVVGPGQRCISSSNRNFENRQGPASRTHLASPAMVAAAAISGSITDVRAYQT
jgi:3-isopropylmalate/(R)-2-methylmalate dehydratase large subunit